MAEPVFIGANVRHNRTRIGRFWWSGECQGSGCWARGVEDRQVERQQGLPALAAKYARDHRAGEPAAAVGAAEMGGRRLLWDRAAREGCGHIWR